MASLKASKAQVAASQAPKAEAPETQAPAVDLSRAKDIQKKLAESQERVTAAVSDMFKSGKMKRLSPVQCLC